MFCPSCRSEFREGFTECADCGEQLVKELRPEAAGESPVEGLVTVHMTADAEELGNIVDRFDKADLAYVVEAGTATAILDNPEAEVPHHWRARLMVIDEHAERARRIVHQETSRKRGDYEQLI